MTNARQSINPPTVGERLAAAGQLMLMAGAVIAWLCLADKLDGGPLHRLTLSFAILACSFMGALIVLALLAYAIRTVVFGCIMVAELILTVMGR